MAYRGLFIYGDQIISDTVMVRDIVNPPPPESDAIMVPTREIPPGSGLFLPEGTVENPPGSGLFDLPPGVSEVPPGSGLFALDIWSIQTPFDKCWIDLPYDDTWDGQRAWFWGAERGPWTPEETPWYDPAQPESREFAGVQVLEVKGLEDSAPVDQSVTGLLGDGAAAGRPRYDARPITFTALIVAATNAGATYGLRWLSRTLRTVSARPEQPGPGYRAHRDLQFFTAHPGDTEASPDTLIRIAKHCVLTEAPKIVGRAGLGGSTEQRQASIFRVEWTLTALNPHLYTHFEHILLSSTDDAGWDEKRVLPIEWAHAPNCDAGPDTDIPVLYAHGCEPEPVAVRSSPPPVCGSCVPVGDLIERVWRLPPRSTTVEGIETVASISVANHSGSDAVTVDFYWKPVGFNNPEEYAHPLRFASLPPYATVTADSITGRGRSSLGRPIGIITTPSGAPWQPTVLSTDWQNWELVMRAPVGVNISIILELRNREV